MMGTRPFNQNDKFEIAVTKKLARKICALTQVPESKWLPVEITAVGEEFYKYLQRISDDQQKRFDGFMRLLSAIRMKISRSKKARKYWHLLKRSGI